VLSSKFSRAYPFSWGYAGAILLCVNVKNLVQTFFLQALFFSQTPSSQLDPRRPSLANGGPAPLFQQGCNQVKPSGSATEFQEAVSTSTSFPSLARANFRVRSFPAHVVSPKKKKKGKRNKKGTPRRLATGYSRVRSKNTKSALDSVPWTETSSFQRQIIPPCQCASGIAGSRSFQKNISSVGDV